MTVVAILYPGDMGTAFARVLKAAGHRVISPLSGRSKRTQTAADQAGIEAVPSLRGAVGMAQVILSLVPPAAVLDVAGQTIRACQQTDATPLFIDLNAKTPAQALELSRRFGEASLGFINACIIGRAAQLAQEGRIYTSGPEVSGLEDLFDGVLPVITLGKKVEQASVFKMCFAGFNKTVTAALFETANTANAFGIADALFDLIQHHLSGTMNDMAKLVPTYPRHVARRSQEMRALAQMLEEAGLPNVTAHSAAQTFEAIAQQEAWRYNGNEADMASILRSLHYQA